MNGENYIVNREIGRGDVFWCDFGNGFENEQGGMRPAVIVSNEMCNKFSPTVSVVPLTTRKKKPLPTHTSVTSNRNSIALCEQIITISKSRLGDYISRCTDDEMESIAECIQIQLGLK